MEGRKDLLKRIVDELVEAGYHRARTSSLPPFDKLTGGLVWCINASNADVDFDLFYDDDATLDYKTKMGEAIEVVLQKMECPHPLQAHQIQGLDYPAVYPVVQWLVKHVLMAQETQGDQVSHCRFTELRDSELRHEKQQESELLLEINKMNELVERVGGGELLQRLMPLVEQLKMSQEEELNFHSSCEKKHVELLASFQDLESKIDHFKESDDHKTELENTLHQDCRKLKALRGDLAKKNQNLLLCRRKLDELPSQSELMQYERCFVELYMHIQEKLQETRKYFATYNALAEANELTLKEISLLNSINVQFKELVMSQEGRTKFVASMSDVAKGVHQKVEKMEARFLAEQNTLSELKERHSWLVAERRQYANLVKLFQEECTRNEMLRSSVFPSL